MKTTPRDWNARIDGKITEAMCLTNKSKQDLSSAICGNRQKLTRLSGKRELWKLPFREITLIAEAANCDIEFVRRQS